LSILAHFSTFISQQVELLAFVNAMTCLLRLLAHMTGALQQQSLQQARGLDRVWGSGKVGLKPTSPTDLFVQRFGI